MREVNWLKNERYCRATTVTLNEGIMALLRGGGLIVKKQVNRTTLRTLPEGIVALLHGSDVIVVK